MTVELHFPGINLTNEPVEQIHIPVYRPVKDIDLLVTKDNFGNAGYDLCTTEKHILGPNEIRRVELNAHFAIPQGYFGYLTPRSGLSSEGINVIQGVIDSTYRGQVKAIVKNETDQEQTIERGLRVAQILFLKHETPFFTEVDSVEQLGDTVRGASGFGESGKF